MRVRWLATAIALLPGFAAHAASGEGSTRTALMNESVGEVAMNSEQSLRVDETCVSGSLLKRIRFHLGQSLRKMEILTEDWSPRDFATGKTDIADSASGFDPAFLLFPANEFTPFRLEAPCLLRRGPPCF